MRTHQMQTRSALVQDFAGQKPLCFFFFFPSLPSFTRLLNNPTFRARKRRLSRMTSGRHICLARHHSESRGWNRSVAFARDNGDDSNKHMASRAARPPFTEEDACEEPLGPTSLCTPHTFHTAEDFFFLCLSLAHPIPFFPLLQFLRHVYLYFLILGEV